jgi:CheY-like chemotaxis protein
MQSVLCPSKRLSVSKKVPYATILCIDDDPSALELHKAVLCSKGYTVLSASDGPTGIALTRTHSIDLVVLDFNMAGMDGNEVTQVLMKEQPNLPVVIRTGYFDGIPECLKWFADALLLKGDSPDTLLSTVARLVAGKKAPAGSIVKTSERLSA